MAPPTTPPQLIVLETWGRGAAILFSLRVLTLRGCKLSGSAAPLAAMLEFDKGENEETGLPARFFPTEERARLLLLWFFPTVVL